MREAKGKINMPKIELDSGVIYEGEWLNGQRDGNGSQTWQDQSKFVGEWKDNQANGKGTLYHGDGDIY